MSDKTYLSWLDMAMAKLFLWKWLFILTLFMCSAVVWTVNSTFASVPEGIGDLGFRWHSTNVRFSDRGYTQEDSTFQNAFNNLVSEYDDTDLSASSVGWVGWPEMDVINLYRWNRGSGRPAGEAIPSRFMPNWNNYTMDCRYSNCSYFGGANFGKLYFNNYFLLNDQDSQKELVLHEAGHIFGMGHPNCWTLDTVMYTQNPCFYAIRYQGAPSKTHYDTQLTSLDNDWINENY